MTEKRERKQDPPGKPSDIREVIIARMGEKGISCSQLAELSGVSWSHIKDYAHRRTDMVGKKLDRVLLALGLEWPK